MTLALTDCCDAGVICRLLKLYGCSHNCSVPVQSDSNSKTKVIETVGKEKHTKKKKKKRKERHKTKTKQTKRNKSKQLLQQNRQQPDDEGMDSAGGSNWERHFGTGFYLNVWSGYPSVFVALGGPPPVGVGEVDDVDDVTGCEMQLFGLDAHVIPQGDGQPTLEDGAEATRHSFLLLFTINMIRYNGRVSRGFIWINLESPGGWIRLGRCQRRAPPDGSPGLQSNETQLMSGGYPLVVGVLGEGVRVFGGIVLWEAKTGVVVLAVDEDGGGCGRRRGHVAGMEHHRLAGRASQVRLGVVPR